MNITNKKNILNQKGIIFTTDALISFVIALITTLVFVVYLTNTLTNEERNLSQIELDEKAIFIIDSMVKNQNSENALLGACNYDQFKKRVLTNNLNYNQIKTNSKTIATDKFFVKEIIIKYLQSNQKETITLSKNNSNNCINVKRFALIDGLKSTIEVKTCQTENA